MRIKDPKQAEEIINKTLLKHKSWIFQVWMAWFNNENLTSSSKIAKFLGKKDHRNVAKAVRILQKNGDLEVGLYTKQVGPYTQVGGTIYTGGGTGSVESVPYTIHMNECMNEQIVPTKDQEYILGLMDNEINAVQRSILESGLKISRNRWSKKLKDSIASIENEINANKLLAKQDVKITQSIEEEDDKSWTDAIPLHKSMIKGSK